MKTSVEIDEALMEEARKVAAKEGTTFRALIEDGLRKAMEALRTGGSASKFRLVTFRGDGLLPEVREGTWEHIRDRAYKGRGA